MNRSALLPFKEGREGREADSYVGVNERASHRVILSLYSRNIESMPPSLPILSKVNPMPSDPFYRTPAWRQLRARFLANNQVCSNPGCRGRSSRVDHVQSRRRRPDRALDETNLQAFCEPCHNAKTARHDGGFGNARKQVVERDADGWPVWRGSQR